MHFLNFKVYLIIGVLFIPHLAFSEPLANSTTVYLSSLAVGQSDTNIFNQTKLEIQQNIALLAETVSNLKSEDIKIDPVIVQIARGSLLATGKGKDEYKYDLSISINSDFYEIMNTSSETLNTKDCSPITSRNSKNRKVIYQRTISDHSVWYGDSCSVTLVELITK